MAKPDGLSHHEVLHTAHIIGCIWSDHVLDHAAVQGNPELKAQAEKIAEAIGAFYVTVGGLKP